MDAASFRERFGSLRILWQTRLGGYCLGLEDLVPVAVVVSMDDGPDFDAIERESGIRFCSYERTLGRRLVLDDDGIDLLIGALRGKVEAALRDSPPEHWVAVCPYACRTLPEFAATAGIRGTALDWDRFWWFSDKKNLQAGQTELRLPRMPGRWLCLRPARYSELASEFGARFVVQAAVGAAGNATAMVESEVEFSEAAERFGGADVWLAPYAGSLSFNVNAVAAGKGTAVGYPSVQIVGQPALGSRRGGHCGNDFSATAEVSRTLLDSIREQTARIGDWMARRGYRGLFGLDFVVYDATGEACAVDLNPRWQGSTSLQTQAERRQGRLPLAAAAIAWQLCLLDDSELRQMSDSFFEPLEGAQMFPKNRKPGYWKATRALDIGPLRLSEAQSLEQVLISGGIPRPGRPLAPGVTLLRISSLRQSVDPFTGQLRAWAQEAARTVYDRLALEPETA